jgi:hypothetical protein
VIEVLFYYPYQPQARESILDWEQLTKLGELLSFSIVNINASAGDCQYACIKHGLRLPEEVEEMRRKVHDWLQTYLANESWAPNPEEGPQTFKDQKKNEALFF